MTKDLHFLFWDHIDVFQATGEPMAEDYNRFFAIISCVEEGQYRIHSVQGVSPNPALPLPADTLVQIRDGSEINLIPPSEIDLGAVECGFDYLFRCIDGRWQQMDEEGDWVKVPIGGAGHKYHYRDE